VGAERIEHWSPASLSAASLPAIPAWLGIHSKVVRVPLDSRLLISSLISQMASLSEGAAEDMAWMLELESVNIDTPAGE